MSRGLWFVLGTGAGVYVTNRARRLADSLTADGVRDRVHGLSHGARLLREEMRSAQQEKEGELRERLGLAPTGPPALAGPAAPATPEPRRLHTARRTGETTD